MIFLHTSDWHIGRALFGKRRYDEQEAFLDWLADTVDAEKADALLVAGDIFDTGTPGSRAQELYYRFLVRLSASACRHVVIIGGNHDSPSFLDAPKPLLAAFGIHVVGAASEDPAREVIELKDAEGRTLAVVCAVPYLRERDLRTAEAGEGTADKDRKALEGIHAHYAAVFEEAVRRRDAAGGSVPLVAMGHLFAAGGEVSEGDGVRELYIGSLARVGTDLFPREVDYVALGHLHVPQCLRGTEHMRYSGSPIPMGFGEAGQSKSIVRIRFDGRSPDITLLPVPSTRTLARYEGTLEQVGIQMRTAGGNGRSIWAEVEYDGPESPAVVRDVLETMAEETGVEILRIRSRALMARTLAAQASEESLDDLSPSEVFDRCLLEHEVPPDWAEPLRDMFREVMRELVERDPQDD